MNCKKCEAELEEGMKFCPSCGAAQNEPEVEELLTEALAEEAPAEEVPVLEEPTAKPGLGAGKIALLVVLGIAAIAVVVALLLSGRGGETPAETTAPTVPTENTEAMWAAAEKKANDVLNEWLSGEKTEDSFATLAGTYSVDGGSYANGGLYEDVYVGQMVEEFNDWCFDESRQPGDYGIVKTTYGYHIMYFVGSEPAWFVVAEEDLMVDKGNAFLEEMLAKYPAEIDYSAIKLGSVDFTADDAEATDDTGEADAPTTPADGNPDDVTCKGSYTVSDEEIAAAADDVVATMGDVQLTNAELQVYYWMQVYDFLNQYAAYASMFGMDYSQPLDTQISIDGTLTWQQFFLDTALESWCNDQAMALGAKEAGYVLPQDYLDDLESLPQDLEDSAADMGYENAEAMIQRDMGVGAGVEDYLGYLETYYLGYMFYGETMESIELTDAEVEAYFDEHAEEYKENGLEKTDEVYVDVRHILITPESAAN